MIAHRKYLGSWVVTVVMSVLIYPSFLQAELLPRTLDSSAQEMLFGVYLNQQDLHEVVAFIRAPSGQLFVSEADLTRWRIRKIDKTGSVIYQNQRYYPLNDIDIDEKNNSIYLRFPPDVFESQIIYPTPELPGLVVPTRPEWGAFLNYNTLAQRNTDIPSQISGFFTPGVYSAYGSAVSSFLVQHMGDANDTIRLNTTWQTDYPARIESLRVGDSFSTPGMWGRSVGFGGIQWGTNFATQPSLLTFPLPSMKGAAVVPSTVDIYVNNAMMRQEQVSAGPFAINAIPVITGAGTVSVVTTDILGRQQIVNLPYYASAQLLKPGLHDYSLELGFVRENFALQSNDYGALAFVGTDTVGINDRWTGQWHVEVLKDQQTVGVGQSHQLFNWGILSASVAGSHSDLGEGGLVMLGFQRHTFSGISYGINGQASTEDFTQIGFLLDDPAPALIGQAFVGVRLPGNGSVGVSYTQQNNRESPNVGFISVSYTQSFFQKWTMNVTALKDVSVHPDTGQNSVYLTLTRSMNDPTTFNMISSIESGNNQGAVQLMRTLPLGPGWGYNLYASEGNVPTYQALVSAQTDKGLYNVGFAQQEGQAYQLAASGGIAWLGGSVYLTRQLGDSFAVVQIPGYSDVRVYSNHQEIGRTDKSGNVFLPILLPYQDNLISIESADLPIDAVVKRTEIHAIPYNQSGLVLKFPFLSTQGVMAQLIQSDGRVVPAGAVVVPCDETGKCVPGEGVPVVEEGNVFLTGFSSEGEAFFQAYWEGTQCHFKVFLPKSGEMGPLPQLGKVTCVS